MPHRLLMKCRVAAVIDLSRDVKLFRFTPVNRAKMPAFSPGAHVNLRLPDAGVRSYSICSDPDDLSCYEIAVKREPHSRGGSAALHDRYGAGDPILVSHPLTTFGLAPEAAGHLMIAGGVGLTPFLPMACALRSAGAPFRLHVALKTRGGFADLRAIAGGLAAGDTILWCADDTPTARLDVPRLIADLPAGWHVYCCGPDRLMDEVAEAASGLDPARVHYERFHGLDAAAAAQGDPFEIFIPSRGLAVAVGAGETAAQALARAGQPVALSCEGGVCRTCVTRYLEGDAIHRDRILKPEERGSQIALCVSRASGRLVLDL